MASVPITGPLLCVFNVVIKRLMKLALTCVRGMLSICCVSRPKVAVVVVKKRINSRFFANDRGGLGNPMSGTIVDTEATRPEW